jgi:hypothetical protein
MDRKMSFVAVSRSPLLTHNPAIMKRGVTKSGKPSAKSSIPSAEEEALNGLYIDNNGLYCLPGISFRNAFIKAAGAWRGGWQKKRETLRGLVAHCVAEPEFAPILDAKGKPAKDYAIDTRRAVVQRQGILRSRPRFEEWQVKFDIVYDADFLTENEEVLRELFINVFNDAGNRLGVGDYRPERSGWFGRFLVK